MPIQETSSTVHLRHRDLQSVSLPSCRNQSRSADVLVVMPILFNLDTRMAWLSLITMSLLFLPPSFFSKGKTLETVDEAEVELTTLLQENLTELESQSICATRIRNN